MKGEIFHQCHDDIEDQLLEAEEESAKMLSKSNPTFSSSRMTKEEKSTFKLVRKVLGQKG